MQPRDLRPGDPICSLYSTRAELAEMVADYMSEGLRRGQRAWFISPGDEGADVHRALLRRGIDVDAEIARRSLQLISGAETYLVHGSFDPERAVATFNEAIDQAYRDGFTGFRAAAEMSWALTDPDRMNQLIVYEALLKALFSTSRATGLCLYNRTSTPLDVINGALATHPVVRSHHGYGDNPFYDASTVGLTAVDPEIASGKVAALDRS